MQTSEHTGDHKPRDLMAWQMFRQEWKDRIQRLRGKMDLLNELGPFFWRDEDGNAIEANSKWAKLFHEALKGES